jgi:hypothetical protein
LNSHLNLIGSIIIGGLMFLAINRFNASVMQNSHEVTMDTNAGKNLTAISKLIQFDFNRIGLGVPVDITPILTADTSRTVFLTDIDRNGVVDTLSYILSDPSQAYGTENPRDRILYRRINSETLTDAALGVTRFRMRYYDSMGNETYDTSIMRRLDISLTVESTMNYDLKYSKFFWQASFSPPNLARF